MSTPTENRPANQTHPRPPLAPGPRPVSRLAGEQPAPTPGQAVAPLPPAALTSELPVAPAIVSDGLPVVAAPAHPIAAPTPVIAGSALRSLTRRCLSIAKNKFRNTPAKLEVLGLLKVEAGSRSGKLQEALEWESAWEEVDAAWVPLTGVTLASFKAQRLAAGALLETHTNVQASAKGEATQLTQLKDQLSEACRAWYEAATNVFLEGTPEGDMIRSTVPTTYTPPSNAPTALEINTATPQVGGNIATTYVPDGGAGATSTRLEWQVVGVDAGYAHSVAVNLVGQTISGFTSGQTVNLRVKTANAAGTTYSAVKTVTLP